MHNEIMMLSGQVRNGVVVLDGGPVPPEGTCVTVSVTRQTTKQEQAIAGPIAFPLLETKTLAPWFLTNSEIAALEDEHASA